MERWSIRFRFRCTADSTFPIPFQRRLRYDTVLPIGLRYTSVAPECVSTPGPDSRVGRQLHVVKSEKNFGTRLIVLVRISIPALRSAARRGRTREPAPARDRAEARGRGACGNGIPRCAHPTIARARERENRPRSSRRSCVANDHAPSAPGLRWRKTKTSPPSVTTSGLGGDDGRRSRAAIRNPPRSYKSKGSAGAPSASRGSLPSHARTPRSAHKRIHGGGRRACSGGTRTRASGGADGAPFGHRHGSAIRRQQRGWVRWPTHRQGAPLISKALL